MALSEEAKEVQAQLEDFDEVKKRVRNLQQELEELQTLYAIPKKNDKQNPSGSRDTTSPQEKWKMRKDEVIELISESIDEALRQEDRFLRRMVQLNAREQNLLMERYMTGKPIKQIARERTYSISNTYTLYDNIAIKISKIETSEKSE